MLIMLLHMSVWNWARNKNPTCKSSGIHSKQVDEHFQQSVYSCKFVNATSSAVHVRTECSKTSYFYFEWINIQIIKDTVTVSSPYAFN